MSKIGAVLVLLVLVQLASCQVYVNFTITGAVPSSSNFNDTTWGMCKSAILTLELDSSSITDFSAVDTSAPRASYANCLQCAPGWQPTIYPVKVDGAATKTDISKSCRLADWAIALIILGGFTLLMIVLGFILYKCYSKEDGSSSSVHH